MAHKVRRALGESNRRIQLKGTVGFDNLPDQLVSIRGKFAYSFNLMCIGEPGIGKSTLIDTLFKTELQTKPQMWRQEKVTLDVNTFELDENGVIMQLTVIDSRGFTDQIDKTDSFRPIVEYVDKQLDLYMKEEMRARRHMKAFKDTRVHCCLYFITPTGHSLKSLDLQALKELQSRCNVVPVIAKADTITKEDLERFRKRINNELADNGITLYKFPEENAADTQINAAIPFGVVGSRTEVGFGDNKVRARQYPWGLVEVENEKHCDFVKLREMLIRKNIIDLIEHTHKAHFESFRANEMKKLGYHDKDDEQVTRAYEEKKKTMEAEMKTQEEKMRQRFVQKVQQKEAALKQAQVELTDRYEKMEAKVKAEQRELKQKLQQLEDQHAALRAASTASPPKRKSKKFGKRDATPQL